MMRCNKYNGGVVYKSALAVLMLLLFGAYGFAQQTEHGVAKEMHIVRYIDIINGPQDTTTHRVPDAEDEETPSEYPLDGTIPVIRDTVPTPSAPGNNPRPQSPTPATNFTGLTLNNSIPPDVQGAAGPSYLMQPLNDHVRILSKTGTTTSTVTVSTWWTSLSPGTPFDPRIQYDPYGQRWIMVYADGAESTSSCILLCVSATNDPTGTWYFYKITADATGTNWLDFPTLGFNKNWIVVTGNMYSVSSNSYSSGKIFAFDKAGLYAHGSGAYTAITSSYATIQPAVAFDTTVNSEFMICNYNPGSAALLIMKLKGSVGSESVSNVGVITGTTTWAFSPSSDFAPQLGSTHNIDLDDARMQNLVYRNNNLWFVNNVFLPRSSPTRCSVQWWETDTSGTTQQHAFIDDATATNFYAYPSICVNSYNDALIGYSSFSATQYASCNYSFRYSCDTLSTLESDYQYKAGQNTYYLTFGGSNNRWGDYSATVVDPTNDLDFWTVQERATSTANSWGTWWAKLTPTHTANGGAGTWTWTGERSTSWFESCNWDKGSLPDASSDVVIPGGTTYDPTITSGTGYCKTITIATAAGAVLNINTSGGGLLSVAQ